MIRKYRELSILLLYGLNTIKSSNFLFASVFSAKYPKPNGNPCITIKINRNKNSDLKINYFAGRGSTPVLRSTWNREQDEKMNTENNNIAIRIVKASLNRIFFLICMGGNFYTFQDINSL